jgi:RNA 2',3'-cyclic 3'-phosphodiesterase
MRLFTAIELPEDVRAHLGRVRAQLVKTMGLDDAVSWVKSENLHVTLKFLGEVPDADAKQLVESLTGVASERMELSAAGTVYFPKRGPVRVIAVGLDGDVDKLLKLYNDIEDACAAAGFAREGRAYTPHVTLGRARRTSNDIRDVRQAELAGTFPGPSFRANGFVLIHSQPKPTGSIYTVAARFPPPGRT